MVGFGNIGDLLVNTNKIMNILVILLPKVKSILDHYIEIQQHLFTL